MIDSMFNIFIGKSFKTTRAQYRMHHLYRSCLAKDLLVTTIILICARPTLGHVVTSILFGTIHQKLKWQP